MGRDGCSAWLVLLVVALNTGFNAFVYMNTSAAEEAFVTVFAEAGVDESEISRTYSYFLLTVMLGMTPGMLLAVKREALALGFSVCMNVLAAWLRWCSVRSANYTLLLGSVLVNGAGAWTILALPSQISAQRFPSHRRTLTTSLAVQANYAGWLLGALLPPLAVSSSKTHSSLEVFCLWQAVSASLVVLAFAAFYRPVRVVAADQATGSELELGHSHSDGQFSQLFEYCKQQPLFVLQVLAYGALGGVSFAMPSAATFILKHFGLTNNASSFVNLAFIGSGVVAGILLGRQCNDRKWFGLVLKILFVLCSLCLLTCAALTEAGVVHGGQSSSQALLILLMAGAGMTSLGFIGVAIEEAASHPVGAGYACWFVEIIVQAVGGGLGFWVNDRHGFTKLAAVVVAATVCLLLFHRDPACRNPFIASVEASRECS